MYLLNYGGVRFVHKQSRVRKQQKIIFVLYIFVLFFYVSSEFDIVLILVRYLFYM